MTAIGAGNQPIFVGSNGDAEASGATIGSDTRPLKMEDGILKPIDHDLHEKTIVTVVDYGDQTADILATIVVDDTEYVIHDKTSSTPVFVVTFQDWDTTILNQQSVEKGSDATPPVNPTREGYTFASWSGNYTNVQKNELVTATYTINKYTVTFKLNGGTISGSSSDIVKNNITHGTTIGSIKPGTNPTRASTARYIYTFSGWDKSDVTAVVSNTTVTAQWNVSTRYYDIIWKNNGGTQLRKDSCAYGTTPSYGSTPVAENRETGKTYVFTGWSPTISTVTGSATYTAQYTTSATTFSVYFNPNGGKINGSTGTYTKTGVAYNTKLSDVPPPTATRDATSSYSYSFYGWGTSTSTSSKVDPTAITLTGSATYYALWTATPIASKYTVKFNPDGGKIDGSTSVVTKSNITSGTKVSAIPPPSDSSMTRDTTVGYTYAFNGWSRSSGGTKIAPANVSVTSDMTLYALWTATARKYSIQFFNSTKENVKTSTSLYGPNSVTYGTTPTYGGTATSSLKPTDAETGKTYSFTGWKRTTDGGTGIKTVSGAEQYYAQYTSSTDTYTVTFKPNGGKLNGSTSDQSKSVAYGTNLSTADTYTKARDAVASGTYSFVGWSESSSGTVITTDPQITSAKTYYAIWKLTKYTYTVRFFYKLGSTGEQIQIGENQTITYGEAATSPTKPTITGWTAGEWNPSSFSSVTKDMDIVSTYTINSHTLTITPRNTVSGGTAPTTTTEVSVTGGGVKTYGTVVTPSASVKSGYTDNWEFTNFKNSSGSVISDVTMPDSDVTIYADFTPKHTVKFVERLENLDGTYYEFASHTYHIVHGGSATPPEKASVEGHTAGDWVGTYTNIQKDETIVCTHTLNTCKVTFSYYNAETPKTVEKTVKYGTKYSTWLQSNVPTDTKRTGYEFTSWKDPDPASAVSDDEIVGNCTIEASYTLSTYTVKFYDRSNNVYATYSDVKYGTKLSEFDEWSEPPTWDDYHEFLCWGTMSGSKFNPIYDGTTRVTADTNLYADHYIHWNFHGTETLSSPPYGSLYPDVVYQLNASYRNGSYEYSYYDCEPTIYSKMKSSIPTQASSTWVQEKWTFINIERSDGWSFDDDANEITTGGGNLRIVSDADFYCRYIGELKCTITLDKAASSEFKCYTNHSIKAGQYAKMFRCDSVTFTHNATPKTHKMKLQLLDGSTALYSSIDITSYNGQSETILPNSSYPSWVSSGSWIKTLGNKFAFYESKYSGCTVTWDVTTTMYVEIGPTSRDDAGEVMWERSRLFSELYVGQVIDGPSVSGMKKLELEVVAKDTTNKTVTFMTTRALSDTTGAAITRVVDTTKYSDFSWGKESTTSLRHYLNNDFLSCINSITFKYRLAARRNYYRTSADDSGLHYTDDKVWIPDIYEVGGVATSAFLALTSSDTGATVFTKFSGINSNNSNATRKYRSYNNTLAVFWLRSNYKTTYPSLTRVSGTGSITGSGYSVSAVYGIVPCFMLSFA